MVQKKYREAERLVAPESRDTYYAQEKSVIKDYAITGVNWEKDFQKAEVQLTSQVTVRHAMMGQFDVRVPFASHWMLENGHWMWYIPTVYSRETPFGTMKVDQNAAQQSGMDLQAMVAKGPDAAKVQEGVKVDKNRITIPEGVGNKGTVTVENTLPGVVRIYTQIISTVNLEATLSQTHLGLGDKATLTIRRFDKPVKGSVVYVRVDPTGQSIPVAVD